MPTTWSNIWSTKMAPQPSVGSTMLALLLLARWTGMKLKPIQSPNPTKLNAIATMEFDWLDCPVLTQSDTIDHPIIDTEDLSIASFDAGHKPSGTAVADKDSLATAQASVAGMEDSKAAPHSASTAIQGSSKLVPIDVDANDLASMVDTVYTTSEPLSDSSSDSSILGDPPEDSQENLLEHCMFHYSGATSVAPPDDMDVELFEEDPDPVADDACPTLPLYHSHLLETNNRP